jgi:hypothetical protein
MSYQDVQNRIKRTNARRAEIKPTPHNPKPWVIVTYPGTDEESIFSDHESFKEARINTKNVDSDYWDIMRRLDDGTLTTDF